MKDLCEEIKPKYDFLLEKIPLYSKRKRLVAEVDVLAFKKNICDVYEVKCSYRITKARHQLRKIRKLLSRKSKVRNTFFFCGEAKTLIMV